MKRPLALVGFCYLLTQAAAVFFGAQLSLILACCCLLGFLASLFWWKTRAAGVFPVALLAMSLAFGSFFAGYQAKNLPALALDGKDAVIDGVVCELPYQSYNRSYYIVEVKNCSLPGVPEGFKLRLSSQGTLTAEPYSRIRGKMHLFLPNGGEGYSSRSYYASKGIMMFAYLYEYEGVQVTPPAWKPPYYYALKLRSALLKSVRSMLPPQEARLINGVLFGDQTSLSPEVASDFRTIGISHILSVSGLHMATMAQLLLMLLLFFRVPKKPAAMIATGGVLGFMAVTCFVPTVTRSGVMCLLYLFGIVLSRRPDALNSLGASVLLIALSNPYAAADVGLLLSFFATLGLILFSGKVSCYLNDRYDKIKYIGCSQIGTLQRTVQVRGESVINDEASFLYLTEIRRCSQCGKQRCTSILRLRGFAAGLKYLRPLVRSVNETIATTAGATVFTLPIVILFFGSISLIAPLSNLLLLVASTLLMEFASVAAVLNLIAPQSYLAMPFALVSGLLAKYMQACAHGLAQIPYASIPGSYGYVLIWLSGSILLFAAAYLVHKSRRIFKAAAWLSVILLLTGMFSYQISVYNVTRIAVLDAGSAQTVVITRNGHAAVVGCGGFSSNTVSSYLRSQGISRLDYLQPLTQDAEELKNCSELMKAFRPRQLLMQEDDRIDGFIRQALPKAEKVTGYRETAQSQFWGNAEISVRNSGKAAAARITADGVSVLLFPGGADYAAVPTEWLCSDILVMDKVPENFTLPEPYFTVLSMNEEDLSKAAAKAKSLRPIVTGGRGNVILELSGSRTIKIRRE
ncbi:MAG TPA: ComEC/Rec2 family competence protein [Caproiciproducens sp.]|nr:ComEC/Rec2 family competence protein [Caproiciproducens sp.]